MRFLFVTNSQNAMINAMNWIFMVNQLFHFGVVDLNAYSLMSHILSIYLYVAISKFNSFQWNLVFGFALPMLVFFAKFWPHYYKVVCSSVKPCGYLQDIHL